MSADAAENEFKELATELSFEEALERVKAAIHVAGMRVFATVDHATAAANVGLSMPPTTVLIYGSPKGGTPVMLASPVAALDLPLRVLVRAETNGRACIAFHPIAQTLRNAGVPGDLADRLVPAQRIVVEALRA